MPPMKTWEKIQKLDNEYQKLRQDVLLGKVDSFTIAVEYKNNAQAALLEPTAKKPAKRDNSSLS